MKKVLIKKLIEQIKKETDLKKLHKLILDYHPYDIAIVFKSLLKEERIKIYNSLTSEELADIFEYLDDADVVKYLEEMNVVEGTAIINRMETDEAADILNEMSEEGIDQYYLEKMPLANSDKLNKLVKYKSDVAGSIMGTNYIEVNLGTSIKDAMKKLVKKASDVEVIDPLFVVDEKRLVGTIELKKLIIARSYQTIDEITDKNIIYCNVDDEITGVTKKLKDYNLLALPVVENQVLVGVITIDDAIDEVVDNLHEDYEMMAGVTGEIDGKSNIFNQVLKRLPWLVALLIVSLLISNITSKFEQVIVEVTIFAFFQSMIFDMAGNAGTQSLAVTVRSISRDDLKTSKQIRHHLIKELFVSCIIGLILGSITFITSYIYMLIWNRGVYIEWLVALIIAISLVISLIVTEILGTLIPIFFYKIKVDPAVASGPLITTLSDTLSIVIYFGLASMFMNLVLVGGTK